LYVTGLHQKRVLLPDEDPSNLKAAVIFGVLYVAVLFAVAVAKEHFSDKGLYLVAGLSGLTDMDAITLSVINLINSERLNLDTGCRMILVGALSNLVFKGAIVGVLGSRSLFKKILFSFSLSIAAGILLLLLWPKIG
ncbi:MAG: DUF4010 domain-containing protein, partial [Desulfatiglandaceae bacterium]